MVYDNNSYIHYFPMGLAYVASKLRNDGHEVEIYNQDVYHYPESHLEQYLTENHFDVVGVGMCAGHYQYEKFKKIREVVRGKAPLWVGGHMFSPASEYFSRWSEWVCEGEYDYEKDIDNIRLPAWDLFPIEYYSLIRLPHSDNTDRCLPVLSGRGCPFRCNFCYRLEEGYRARSVGAICEEIGELIQDYRISYIDFADELLMLNPDRTREIAEALKSLNIKWMCNGRLNYAKPDVLKKMKEAGCVFINYGIEAVDDDVLEKMNKKLTVKQITEGVEATLNEGISPGLNMIWGNIGDTRKSLWKAVEFLLKYDDQCQMRTIRPVTPYPGSPLFDYAVEKGMIKDVADFYEKKHIGSNLLTVNFTNLSDIEYYNNLSSANQILIENYYQKVGQNGVKSAQELYRGKDKNFGGFRQT